MISLLKTHHILYEHLSKEMQYYMRRTLSSLGIMAVLTCLSFFNTSYLNAGMSENLDKAFHQLGMSSNTTTEGGYQDQTGGFYTGGSFFSRNKVNTAELYSLQLPSYRAGCGGIDMHFGGLSFINAEQFVQMLRQIGSNTAGYAFQLGLATAAPQIHSVLTGLAAKIQEAANMSISSCEAAATLVGGMWPQSDASSQLLCGAMSKELGIVSDWTQGRQKCGTDRTSINARKNEKEEFKSLLGDEYNLAWKALQKNNFLKSDIQLAEFFMSLSGTLISRIVSGKHSMQHIPAKSADPNLIKAIVTGSTPVEIYKCDNAAEDKCLNLTTQKITLPQGSSLLAKTNKFITSIGEKIRSDSALTSEEQGFVDSTSLPMLKILLIESAYKRGQGPIHIHNYSESIAYDIVLQYLDEILSLIEQSLIQLKQAQIDEKPVESFRMGLLESRKMIHGERTTLFQQIMVNMEAIEKTLQIEAKLQNAFISHQQSTKAGH